MDPLQENPDGVQALAVADDDMGCSQLAILSILLP
jgi:hypothetical protein